MIIIEKFLFQNVSRSILKIKNDPKSFEQKLSITKFLQFYLFIRILMRTKKIDALAELSGCYNLIFMENCSKCSICKTARVSILWHRAKGDDNLLIQYFLNNHSDLTKRLT
ncbi:hypothetical protein BpHYR1_044655 [Brachionus plicatilis]|uniref:Uncharacterized protein n=1 Tax=Brachionus plicatilis TaxID=10195 RepID=A0A3M7T6D5_BRAPC|nr:hypothetical protein BpHYR1_044655 [Brachionus plicatilis]